MKTTKQFAFSELASILKLQVKPNHRNFLYLASGTVRERETTYLNLPYDNIFLVDKMFNCSQIINDKLYCIKSDVTEAVETFRQVGIKMDFYSSIQEGLSEGGSDYPLNTNAWYGFVLPILKEQYIHLLHSSQTRNLKRLPFMEHTRISLGHPDYINPKLLTINPQNAELWMCGSCSGKRHEIIFKSLQINIIHRSIWEDIDELDLVFARLNENMKKKLVRPEKIIHFGTHWKDDEAYISQCNQLLELCNQKEAKTIGMIPFGWGDYKGFMQWLESAKFEHTTEIRLYHLVKNDFKLLYNLNNYNKF